MESFLPSTDGINPNDSITHFNSTTLFSSTFSPYIHSINCAGSCCKAITPYGSLNQYGLKTKMGLLSEKYIYVGQI